MAVLTDKKGKRGMPTVGARSSTPFEGFLPVFQSFLESNIANPDNLGADIYRRMLETDETVSSGIDFISSTVVPHLGEYTNTNRKAQKYIDSLWMNCYTSLEQVIEELILALVFGWAVGELVLRQEDGRIWLDDVPFLLPESTTIAIESNPKAQNFGRVRGFKQKNGSGQELPKDRMVYWAHRIRNSNPYGQSRLKPAYKSWFFKDVFLKDWGRALSTFGSPIAVAEMTNPKTQDVDASGNPTTTGQNMLTTLQNLSGGSSIVHGIGDKIRLEQAKVSVGKDFESGENHLNKCILRALLIPALLFEPTDIGSFALGSKHFEIFMRSIARIVKDLHRVLLLQIYRPLLTLNFGPKCPLGEFKAQVLEEEDLKLWAEILFSLVSAGFMSKRELDDLNAGRAKFNLKPLTKLPEPDPSAPEAPQDGAGGQDPNLPPQTDRGGQVAGKTADGREGSTTNQPRPGGRTPTKPQGRPRRNS